MEYQAQYVLINHQKGSVTWYENYQSAVRDQALYGGIVINTATTDPKLVEKTILETRKIMNP